MIFTMRASPLPRHRERLVRYLLTIRDTRPEMWRLLPDDREDVTPATRGVLKAVHEDMMAKRLYAPMTEAHRKYSERLFGLRCLIGEARRRP